MNSGGSRKTTSSAFANINGTRKQIFPYNSVVEYNYRWNKYTISTTYDYSVTYRTYNSGSISIPRGTCYRCSNTQPTFDSTTNTFSFTGTGQISYVSSSNQSAFDYKYVGFKFGINYSTFMGDSQLNKHGYTEYYYCDSGSTPYLRIEDYTLYAYNDKLVREYYAQSTPQNTMGSYVAAVFSSNRYEYPDNGISGSYWYIFAGEV